jgi:hypothetical protein
MVKLEYLLEIDKHWIKTKKWWDNIKVSNELFPKNIKKVTKDEKDIFKIKFLYFIKKIFDIDDLTNIDKIDVSKYDINKLLDNFKLNFDTFKTFIKDDIELKNIIHYILNFREYFSLIKKKLIQIVEPLLNDIYFDKLFRCDNDLTRLCCPIIASIVYIYIMNRDIEKTINLCLNLDNISIQFFVISYLILDNFMDDATYYEENKIIFFKWFMNIVNNPENEVIINEEQSKIWQCITFKKYFCMFVDKYQVNKNKILYEFVKLMIITLKKTDIIQKKSDITDDIVLECTFKKSYVACFFMTVILNNYIKNKLKKKDINLLCKLVFLVQLYDDYCDIEKDILEKNYTYFNTTNLSDNLCIDKELFSGESYSKENIHNNLNFNEKIKKIVISSFSFINNLNEKNYNIYNIIIYFVKYTFLYISYINFNKIDKELINNLVDYSYFSIDLFDYFDQKSYNQYNNKIILNIFKKYITN